MGTVVVGTIIVGIVAAGYLVWRVRRRRERAELVARADRIRRRLAEVEPKLLAVGDRVERLVTQVEGPLRVELQEAIVSARSAAEEARPAAAALPTTVDDAPSATEGRTTEHRAARAVGSAERALGVADERATTIAARLTAVGAGRTAAADAIAEAKAVAESHRADGWNVDEILADLSRLSAELATVDVEPPVDLDVTEPSLDALRKAAEELRGEAAGLPERYRQLTATSSELRTRIEELRGDRDWLVNQLEAWVLLHHRRSLMAVSEHPPAITGRLDEADERLSSAAGDGGMLSMDRQDVRGAAAAIQRAQLLVDQSTELIDEARELNVDLAKSAVEAEELLVDARSVSTALTAYVGDHPHDLTEAFAGPAAALAEQVEEAEASLALEPPDSLGAMTLSVDVRTTGDRMMEEAEREVKRMRALRDRARRALGTARASVGELDDYTDGLLANMFGGGQRRRNVERLQTELRSAERLNELRVNEPERAEREARSVASEARQLLERYKEEDREEERRRRDDDC